MSELESGFIPQPQVDLPKSLIKQARLLFPRPHELIRPFPKMAGQENLKIIQREVPPELIRETIWGYIEGRDWCLKHEKWKVKKPQIELIDEDVNFADFKFAGYDSGTERLILNLNFLRQIHDGQPFSAFELFSFDPKDIPQHIRPQLTLRQQSIRSGAHESTHFLQNQHAPGVIPIAKGVIFLPPSGSTLAYYKQPHELEALVVEGECFLDKYGNNPMAGLENWVRTAH